MEYGTLRHEFDSSNEHRQSFVLLLDARPIDLFNHCWWRGDPLQFRISKGIRPRAKVWRRDSINGTENRPNFPKLFASANKRNKNFGANVDDFGNDWRVLLAWCWFVGVINYFLVRIEAKAKIFKKIWLKKLKNLSYTIRTCTILYNTYTICTTIVQVYYTTLV